MLKHRRHLSGWSSALFRSLPIRSMFRGNPSSLLYIAFFVRCVLIYMKKSYFSAIKPILILHYLKKYGISYFTYFRIAGTDSGMCSNVKVYSRASWGARAPKSVTTMHTPASLFFVHHTEGNFCHDFTSCATQLRGIQNYHMDTRGNSLITI